MFQFEHEVLRHDPLDGVSQKGHNATTAVPHRKLPSVSVLLAGKRYQEHGQTSLKALDC